jgi:hypothetical protein
LCFGIGPKNRERHSFFLPENTIMLHRKYVCLAALSIFAFCPALAQAQFGRNFELAMSQGAAKPGITASGTTTVERKPTQLRLYMQLLAKGKTLQDALAKLKERREAATAQLEALKVDKKSIVFGTPSLANAQSARKRQIEAMVMAQMRARGKKAPKGLQPPQTVTVSATLTAQWPLEAESLEQMLVIAQGIQDKIKAADLAGVKEKDSDTPAAEEEEVSEEASQMANQFGGEQQEQPGEAHFMYVATLPKAEREKAMAEAFKRANQEAGNIAKAAGVTPGPLVGLSGVCSGQGENGENNFMGYDPSGTGSFMRRMLAQQAGGNSDEKQDEEAMSAEPSMLRFNCCATVVFQIGK